MNLGFATFLVILATADTPANRELQYLGTITRPSQTGTAEVKSFSLTTVTMLSDDGSVQLAYHLDERSGGSWGWPEHFGLVKISEEAGSKSRPIRVLQTHENQQYPLPVRSPVFEFREKLVPQSTWTDGRNEFLVTRKRKWKDRDCFQVDVTSNLGRIQTLVVEAASGIIVSLEERVVIGRGDEFQLKMELQTQNSLDAVDGAKNRQVIDSLMAVQSRLGRSGDQKSIELTAEQLAYVNQELPRIQKEAEGTSWSRVVAEITHDMRQQQKRIDGLSGLQKKLVGSPAPQFTLKRIDGTSIGSEDLADKVVVLHFWQYRGEPLNEPYGQVGYLDFLNGKRKKLGIKVVGINVDDRFASTRKATEATRSMKSFLDFMKLDYEMATDDGAVLSEFGDPRTFGSTLPLWIVIGHDGKVVHQHTGYYDIKPDEGLKQLDEAVIEAIRHQKGQSDQKGN